MGTHMKTTIEINDALLLQAKQLAAKRKQTLKSVVEAALRQFLNASAEPQRPFRLRKHTFRGRGLQSHLAEGDWAMVREHIYEGRGG
jgi:Arc/MetJ family transcription regulator